MTIYRFIGAGGGGGGADADRFAPHFIVGNVPAGDPVAAQTGAFRYIPDTGDGAGLALAMTEAAALGQPADIYVRPGIYDLAAGPTVLPDLAVGCRLHGTRSGGSTTPEVEIRGAVAGVNQRILVMLAQSAIDNLFIHSPAPTANFGGNTQVISAADDTRISSCDFRLEGSVTFDRTTIRGIDISGIGGVVEDCHFAMDSLLTQTTPASSLAVRVLGGTVWQGPPNPTVVRNCSQVGGNNAVHLFDVSGAQVEHFHAADLDQPTAAFRCDFNIAHEQATAPQAGFFNHCYAITTGETDLTSVQQQTAFLLLTNLPGEQLEGFAFDHCHADFGAPEAVDPGVEKIAFNVIAQEGAELGQGSFVGCTSRGHNLGLFVESRGINLASLVRDIRVVACVIRGARGNTGTDQYNVLLRSAGDNGLIARVGITNNSLDTSFSGDVINIDGVDITNTIVVCNNIDGGGILDTGTGTELSHNP